MGFHSYQSSPQGIQCHIRYADGLREVICQGRHVLQTDFYKAVNVQSISHVSVLVCVLATISALQFHPQVLGSFSPFFSFN